MESKSYSYIDWVSIGIRQIKEKQHMQQTYQPTNTTTKIHFKIITNKMFHLQYFNAL